MNETADSGMSVLGQFGLVGKPGFDVWFEDYSDFLDRFDEYHGWRGTSKREDKEKSLCFHEMYINGIYQMLAALLERQTRREQSSHADRELQLVAGINKLLH
eukprot:7202015-Prymnesium_polylepis.1